MENKHGIFHSETYGNLRIILEDDVLLFCARDIGEMLGFKDVRHGIMRHCRNIRKRKYQTASGVQVMNFIDATDALRLLSHTNSIAADDVAGWLFTTVIPMVLQEEVKEETPDEEDENGVEEASDKLFMIHADDYIRHLYHLCKLTGMLHRLAVMAERLSSDCTAAVILRETAAASRKNCEKILDQYGLNAEDAYFVDSEKLHRLADNEICLPEDAGYVKSEDILNDLCDAAEDDTLTWCDENG